jgi:hypothetical protein
MKRRKFVVGLGSLAAGGAAATGTGAFSQMGAGRSLSVKVSNDDTDPALKFETKGNYPKAQGGRSIYANVSGGNLNIDLASEGGANFSAELM